MAPRRSTPHPLRALLALLTLICALAALMFGLGRTTPALGLDLAGGTSVTLTAVEPAGRTPPASLMNESVAVMDERVNGFGVSEPSVTRQGSNIIVVQMPGKSSQRLVSLISQTAKMQFRQVYAEEEPGPSTSPAPVVAGAGKAVLTEFQQADCTGKQRTLPGSTDDTRPWIAACDQKGQVKYLLGPVRVQGQEISSAQSLPPDPAQGRTSWQVGLNFRSRGAAQFYDVTRDAYSAYQANPQSPQQFVAIVLDGKVVSAPSIDRGPIGGGRAEIDGGRQGFSEQAADELSKILSYGALPLTFTQGTATTVTPQLGDAQLRAGLEAGGVGLALVVLYCLVYYRMLGLVAITSLGVSAALTYLSVVLLGHLMDFRLSLPGIAGLIVAIGITADSFVVYFERLRDELRDGHTLRSSAERAWTRARRTILVADAVSFLCALVLYVVAIGSVQGFAFALGLTTAIDVVVVTLFTKPLVGLLARFGFFTRAHRMSGLSAVAKGARA